MGCFEPIGRPGWFDVPRSYAALQVTTNFSFLRGGSHPEELVQQAKALGLSAMAVTDRNTLAGVVRAHVAAKEAGLKLIVGARLDIQEGYSLLCLPRDRAAYGRLCRLLSTGQMRAEKGKCTLFLEDVAAHCEGQIFIALPPQDWDLREALVSDDEAGCGAAETFDVWLRRMRDALGEASVYLGLDHDYRGNDVARLNALCNVGRACGIETVVASEVLYHVRSRRVLQDVLTCVREGCTIHEAGFRLRANGERHLKPASDMARLFQDHEAALARTLDIARACRFSLDELVYEYPDEPVPEGASAQTHLETLTWEGAEWRFPGGLPDKVRASLTRELQLIDQLNYAQYFLTVHDIVAFARSRGILCQGRGSAANSSVCYCLGITAVNPMETDLLFERFVSSERKEPPDIDVDFEHERREEVIQYIYARYGRSRAGLAATVISYRARSAVRDVGKAFGLSEDTISALSGMVWGTRSGGVLPEQHVREAGLDPDDPLLARVLELAQELMGFPRHLSQHVGGFVLTRGPLVEVVPVGNAAMEDRTFIEWDKDDLAAVGLLKVDVLALGMLTCIHRAFDLIEAHHNRALTLAKVPRDDAPTYDMLCRADSIGVFQVESRAQMNMLPRLNPRTFYDLVIEVAIVRPGPIQGDMVHPYLRRRDGVEKEDYPAPDPAHGPADELRQILGKTKGVPLFQEQAMRIAMVAARFSDAEVNELRKAMATFRRRGTIGLLQDKMVSAMVARGYAQDFSERCFNQIKGFGDYGFPESHAASFAHLVYVSAWIKCHYPAVFACALLNSQPMGFYAPAQIVRDAREHGVEVHPVDVNFSQWDCSLEDRGVDVDGRALGPALRLGFRQVEGLREADAQAIVLARERKVAAGDRHHVVFSDIHDLKQLAGVSRAHLERLAAADTFRSLGFDRREALWQVKGLADDVTLPLFSWGETREEGLEPDVSLPQMALAEHVINDYQTLRLSLKAHPLSFFRDDLTACGVISCACLRGARDGAFVKVSGLVLVRQRPGTAKGVIFMTLEDESGIANVVVWPKILERFRKVIMGGRLLEIHGRVQRHEDIIHVISMRLVDRTDQLLALGDDHDGAARPEAAPGKGGQEVEPVGRVRAPPSHRHPRNARMLPKSRDFH